MRKKSARKRPYFTVKSAMTAILRVASGKMHHGILFDRRLLSTEILAEPRETRSQACYQTCSLPKTSSWTLRAENEPKSGRE